MFDAANRSARWVYFKKDVMPKEEEIFPRAAPALQFSLLFDPAAAYQAIMKRLALLATIVFATLSTVAVGAADERIATVDPHRASGGNAREFKNRVFPPSTMPRALPMEGSPTQPQRVISQRAAKFLQENESTLSILLVERGRILFEGYRLPASAATAQHSQSMSKSLTAYTIGNLLCDGKIASLDDAAQKYAPSLAGTVYGEATIRHLLTMSSGAALSSSSGNSYEGQFVDVRGGKVSALSVMQRYGGRDIAAGREFRYLANDTVALAFVAEAAGGFLDSFERYIWNNIGAEGPGYWLLDKDGMAMANAGASVATRDWARLALFSIEQLKSGSDCMRNFMKDATSPQIPNTLKRAGRSFPAYGFQTWIRNGTYWWVGYGGQRVGVAPQTEKVVVLTSWRENDMDRVYRLFDDWVVGK